MPLSTRWGTRVGAQAGAKWPADGGAAAWAGVIDNMVSAGLSAALVKAAYCPSHRLYTAYTGPLFRLRRAGDNAETDIAYDPATNRLDTAAIATHCTTNHGYVKTPYDQSGNAADVTQGFGIYHHKIYDGTTGTILLGTLPIMLAGNSTWYERADTYGMTGGPDLTTIYGAKAPGAGQRTVSALGANPGFVSGFLASDLVFVGGNENGGSSHRDFTPINAVTDYCGYVVQIAAGANYSTATCRQDGAALSQAAVLGGTVGLTGATKAFGYGVDHTNLYSSHIIHINSVISGAVLTAAETFNASLKTLAGY